MDLATVNGALVWLLTVGWVVGRWLTGQGVGLLPARHMWWRLAAQALATQAVKSSADPAVAKEWIR